MINVDVLASLPESSGYRPKSNRHRGILIRPEVSFGMLNILNGYGVNGVVSVDYKFNPYFALGGSIGWSSYARLQQYYASWFYNYQNGNYEVGSNNVLNEYYFCKFSSLPLFVNARVNFCDKNWSPFVDLKLGYSISLKDGEKEVYYPDNSSDNNLAYKSTIIMKGISGAVTIGMQYKIFSFGITTSMFTTLDTEWETTEHDGLLTHYNPNHLWEEENFVRSYLCFMLDFSWDIPIGWR